MELDTMFTQQINLRIDCIGCGNKTYQEHDSGFYVCISCGILSTIQHNQELDFNAKNNHTSFYAKGKRRGIQIEDDDFRDDADDDAGLNYADTTYQTSNSENNGMRTPRLSYIDSDNEEVFIKSDYENIIDNQKLFLQIINHISNYLTRLDPFSFSPSVKKEFIELAKSVWVDHIKKETGGYKQKNPKVRSRRNTEDRPDIKKEKIYSSNEENSIKKKTLQNQLNSRKIVRAEILNLDAYKNQKLKSRDKIKKYLEEYDELGQNLNLEQDEKLTYNYLLNLTDKKGIKNIDNNCSYEELIHKLFISKQLNYKHLYKEVLKSEHNKFNSDVILAMIHIVLQSIDTTNIRIFNKHIVTIYKNNEYISNSNFSLNKNEIKLLKFINNEKLLKNVDTMQNRFNTDMDYASFFNNINNNVFGLPEFFTVSCVNVYAKCRNMINSNSSYLHTKEFFCFGVIIYCLKLFYGLNDLTYLVTLKKRYSLEKDIKNSNNKNNLWNLLNKYGAKDSLYKYFEEMPDFESLIQKLSKHTEDELMKKVPWEGIDFKQPINSDKHQFYLDLISKGLIETSNSVNYNHNKIFDHFRQIYKKKNEFVMNIDCSESTQKIKDVKISYTSKFKQKLDNKKKFSSKVENSKEKLSNFLADEVKFYNKLEKKSFKNQKCLKRINIPLPCDDVVLYKKQAFKFEGIMPSMSELIIHYFFKIYFNVDFKLLRKCVKLITKSMGYN